MLEGKVSETSFFKVQSGRIIVCLVHFFSCFFFSFYTPIPPGDLEIGQIAKNQKISQPGQNTIKMYFEKFLSGD